MAEPLANTTRMGEGTAQVFDTSGLARQYAEQYKAKLAMAYEAAKERNKRSAEYANSLKLEIGNVRRVDFPEIEKERMAWLSFSRDHQAILSNPSDPQYARYTAKADELKSNVERGINSSKGIAEVEKKALAELASGNLSAEGEAILKKINSSNYKQIGVVDTEAIFRLPLEKVNKQILDMLPDVPKEEQAYGKDKVMSYEKWGGSIDPSILGGKLYDIGVKGFAKLNGIDASTYEGWEEASKGYNRFLYDQKSMRDIGFTKASDGSRPSVTEKRVSGRTVALREMASEGNFQSAFIARARGRSIGGAVIKNLWALNPSHDEYKEGFETVILEMGKPIADIKEKLGVEGFGGGGIEILGPSKLAISVPKGQDIEARLLAATSALDLIEDSPLGGDIMLLPIREIVREIAGGTNVGGRRVKVD